MEPLWEDVRYLAHIASDGSVAAAARALGVSVSTVYRRVAVLETALGAPCLVRGPGPARLTAAGRTLAEAGRTSARAISRATGEIRAIETALGGEVSLTTVSALFPFLIEPITTLHREHGLVVSLHLGDSGPSVREREVDVAIGIMRRPPPGCWGRRLGRLPYAVFGTHDAVGRAPEPGWVTRSFAETYAPEAAWERRHAGPIAARAPFVELVALVAAGVGVGLMPRAIAAEHRGLVELPIAASTTKLERPLWLLTHPDLRKTARVALLMRAIAGRFEQVL